MDTKIKEIIVNAHLLDVENVLSDRSYNLTCSQTLLWAIPLHKIFLCRHRLRRLAASFALVVQPPSVSKDMRSILSATNAS